MARLTPGTFRYPTIDECFVILEGRGKVRLDSGEETAFGPGDMVFTSLGVCGTWTIYETVRQTFHVDSSDRLAD